MTRKKYYIVKFPNNNMKYALSILSGRMFHILDRVFKMFETYGVESYNKTPRWILHNMMHNNEAIFSLGEHDINYGSSTSSQESSSPLKVKTTSFLAGQLPVEYGTKEASLPENVGAKNPSRDKLESIKVSEMSKYSEEKMTTASTSKGAETNPRDEERTLMESRNFFLGKNSVEIESFSVIKESEFVEVEINFDLTSMSEISSKTTTKQDSSPSKKTKRSKTPEKESRSPVGSPLKIMKSTASVSEPVIDYSDPIILEFLSMRFKSILTYRRECTKQIRDNFKEFLREASFYKCTIGNLNFVPKNIPMDAESYCSDDFKKFRDVLINKANNMFKEVEMLEKDTKKSTKILEECLKEIDNFEKEHAPFLSIRGESIPNIDDLQRLDLHLKEICKRVDNTVFLEDDRRAILVNSSSDFDWFLKHFVKFLIITEILKPTDSSTTFFKLKEIFK